MTSKILPVLAIIGALALTGCTGPGPSASPSPEKKELGEVSTVSELRDGLVKAGFPCETWDQTDVVIGAAQSGTCSKGTVLSTFTSADAAQKSADKTKALVGELIDLSLLVGPNWIINDPRAEAMQKELGGVVVSTKAK
ncbi:hypothetical protein M2390_002915 [Mycetocola sp. BIGb0189]|uniref:hypothetical protein n=1 Tax=Mycetocola sp. BIGb0189 TaxID=2940604 RepID=UPI00216893B2|nr:hypothetical protein [Mycetocola sp. BIGb0189]MCS4277706.1 hypothetical protein [Mycetocola sp. BIGb0189]